MSRFAPIARIAKWVGPTLGFTLICVSIWMLRRQLEPYSYSDIMVQLNSTPASSIALALLLATGAYTVLVGYDALALAYVGHSLPLRRIAMGSFVAHSMSHSLGFHMITAGSIRYRFWSSWGLPNADIARALGFASSSFLSGMILVCGAVLLFEPPETLEQLHLPTTSLRVVGAILVSGVVGFLVWMRFARRPIRIFGTELMIPKVRLALGHLLIAASDWAMAASVAYVLLPRGHGIGLLPFIGVFLFALLVGAIGHVPGGVGVFEVLVVAMLKPHLEPPAVVGSLILYRLIYYVVPFVLGLSLMIIHEAGREGARVAMAAGRATKWIAAAMPTALATSVFSAGAVVLLSSGVPTSAERLAASQTIVPLLIIEISHFTASVLGAALMVLSGFVQRRLQRAYDVITFVLAAAAVATLLRGLVWEVAILLTAVLAIVILSRRQFTRPERLFAEPLPAAWVTGIVTVLALTIWLGAFSFKSVGYSSDLWTEVSISSELSRFLRATLGAFVFMLSVMLLRLAQRGNYLRSNSN